MTTDLEKRLEEIQKLSDEELRIKVAELCGWKSFIGTGDKRYWNKPEGTYAGGDSFNPLPNYTQNLDIMRETEKSNLITEKQIEKYCVYLFHCVEKPHNAAKVIMATARQRAEAFVLTMEGETK